MRRDIEAKADDVDIGQEKFPRQPSGLHKQIHLSTFDETDLASASEELVAIVHHFIFSETSSRQEKVCRGS